MLKQFIKQKIADYKERQEHNRVLAKKMHDHIILNWKSFPDGYARWKSGCNCEVCYIIETLPEVRGKHFTIDVKDSEDKVKVWIRPKHFLPFRSSVFTRTLIKTDGDVDKMKLEE